MANQVSANSFVSRRGRTPATGDTSNPSPAPKDGPIFPGNIKRPQGPQHGPILHYAWWVSDGLGRGDQPTASDLAKLKAAGFKSVINLRAESNADQAVCTTLGLNYKQLNWVDRTAPTEDQIKQIVTVHRLGIDKRSQV